MRGRTLPDSTSNAASCRDVTRDLGKRVDEVRTSQKKPMWDDFAQSNQVEKMRIVRCVGGVKSQIMVVKRVKKRNFLAISVVFQVVQVFI